MSYSPCPDPKEFNEVVLSEALEHFCNILRIDSRNGVSDEAAVAAYLKDVLVNEGFSVEQTEPSPGRISTFARLKGNGSKKPLLLTSHVDVVPWEAAHWTHDPLGAELDDGFIWGRGAIDMKNHTVYTLMTLLEMKRRNIESDRDIIFSALADEEAGCTWGSKWVVENRPELIEAEYALNEIGGFPIYLNNQKYYAIQAEEKGFAWVRMTCQGKPGHGSLPHGDNAVYKLAEAVCEIQAAEMPVHISGVTKTFLNNLASAQKLPFRQVLGLLTQPRMTDIIIDKMIPDAEKQVAFRAMTHNTVCPTGLLGSSQENVIPSQASCVLDCRIIPGQTVDDVLNEIRQSLTVPVEFEVLNTAPPHTEPRGTSLLNLIESRLKQEDPQANITPYMITGFTDAAHFHKLGIVTYGFSPLHFGPEIAFTDLYHGHDERISFKGFRWGTDMFYRVVRDFCAAN